MDKQKYPTTCVLDPFVNPICMIMRYSQTTLSQLRNTVSKYYNGQTINYYLEELNRVGRSRDWMSNMYIWFPQTCTNKSELLSNKIYMDATSPNWD